MAKRNASERLDEAVEALMARPDAPLSALHPRLEALLRIASDLRDLPSEAFKAHLKAELLSRARGVTGAAPPPPRAGRPLHTEDDILARLAELADEPNQMVAHDVRAALRDLPDRAMRFLASLNECTVGVSRFSDSAHWERHPGGDELLHILDGEAEVVTLTEDGPVRSPVRAGSLFICPQGLWHRLLARSPVSLLFATPGEGTEASEAEEPPRRNHGRRSAPRGSRTGRRPAPALVAHDLDSALRGLPELPITSSTTAADVDASARNLARLGPCTLGVMRFSGLTPWERHPDGDELLHPLAGAIDVTVLTDDGPVHRRVEAGSVFVCPRGLWHRQRPQPAVTLLYGTPSETTEVSFAEDPRG